MCAAYDCFTAVSIKFFCGFQNNPRFPLKSIRPFVLVMENLSFLRDKLEFLAFSTNRNGRRYVEVMPVY